MSRYIRCQFCGERVDLTQRKDFESYSGREWAHHIKSKHPETATRPGLIPYGEELEDEHVAQHT